MKLAVTGHRPNKLGGYGTAAYERLFNLAYENIPLFHPQEVITGMALGWDTAVAEASLMLGVPYKAYIPFAGQESQWPPDSQRMYRNLLAHAAEVIECSPPGYSAGKMHVRNARMIDDCTELLALWNGDPDGGTASAVKYATRVGKPIANLWEIWNG